MFPNMNKWRFRVPIPSEPYQGWDLEIQVPFAIRFWWGFEWESGIHEQGGRRAGRRSRTRNVSRRLCRPAGLAGLVLLPEGVQSVG